jgi:3D (Asp-Asp-Asp) domain-containing protein
MKRWTCGLVFFFSAALAGIVSLYISRSMILKVYVSVDGKGLLVRTWSRTVGDLLKDLDIDVGRSDRVYPSPESILRNGLGIYVVRVEERIEVVEERIPAPVYKRVLLSFTPGNGSRVLREGEDGLAIKIYRVRFAQGREIGRRLEGRKVLREPKPRIVLCYKRIDAAPFIEMTATAYSPEEGFAVTATGKRARKGIVAVDPRVIPLGTRLYVEGYGEAVAEDTGGAIKGRRIDLCFETLREARSFGRRKVRVYFLGKKEDDGR